MALNPKSETPLKQYKGNVNNTGTKYVRIMKQSAF